LDAIAPNPVALLEEEALAEIVLECVDSIPWHVGRSKIARILKGSVAQDILKMDLARIARYGALGHLTLAQITAIIDQLIAGGYLRSSRGRRPIILLTPMGRTAFITGELPAIEAPDALKMFIARERCRKCPYNPSLIASGEASPPASVW
jgi:superfamily II DNA helicase RecQ